MSIKRYLGNLNFGYLYAKKLKNGVGYLVYTSMPRDSIGYAKVFGI